MSCFVLQTLWIGCQLSRPTAKDGQSGRLPARCGCPRFKVYMWDCSRKKRQRQNRKQEVWKRSYAPEKKTCSLESHLPSTGKLKILCTSKTSEGLPKPKRIEFQFFFPIEERIIWTSGVGSTQKEKWGGKLGMFWGKIGATPPHLFFFFSLREWSSRLSLPGILGKVSNACGEVTGENSIQDSGGRKGDHLKGSPGGILRYLWENLFKIMRLEVPIITLFHVGRWCLHGGW